MKPKPTDKDYIQHLMNFIQPFRESINQKNYDELIRLLGEINDEHDINEINCVLIMVAPMKNIPFIVESYNRVNNLFETKMEETENDAD